MTIPATILWVAALITLVTAALPVTREQLTRFAELTGLTVTEANARQIIDHFRDLRRWRLITLVFAVPLTSFTGDPFYLVLGWCAVSLFRDVRSPHRMPRIHGDTTIYRGVWLLGLTGAVLTGGYALKNQGVTPTLLIHVVIVIVVAAAVRRAAPQPIAGPEASDDTARAMSAIDRWSARSLYLAGAVVVLSGVVLIPLPSQDALPEYTMPMSFSEVTAQFTTVEKYERPTCPWVDQVDGPCRSWLVNGHAFPQAAPYVIRKGGAPRAGPFVPSPDRKAVVYLTRHDRRMVYQDAEGVHHLTGALADSAVPTPTFHGQNRYVALAKEGAQVTDTTSWATVSIPGVRRVHDLNGAGILATTATRLLVLDHRGRTRLSLPVREPSEDTPEDTYHLRPDGRQLVIIRHGETRVETFTVATGEQVSDIAPQLPGDSFVDTGLGWSEQGRFQVSDTDERVYDVDLATGAVRRHRK